MILALVKCIQAIKVGGGTTEQLKELDLQREAKKKKTQFVIQHFPQSRITSGYKHPIVESLAYEIKPLVELMPPWTHIYYMVWSDLNTTLTGG